MTSPRAGRYLHQDVMGVGSFATVHRAVDERLDDVVVVKILAENHSLNPEVRERYIAEGRALRRVNSAHVVTVHDIGESERQQPYLVLELADLGMCKDLALGSGLTVAGGTAGFRPPELDGGPAVIDTRADLWSLSALVTWLNEGADLPQQLRTVLARGRSDDPDGPDGGTAETSGSAGATAYRGSSSARRLAATALLAVLLGLGAGWLLRGSGEPPAVTASARLQIEAPEQVQVGEPAVDRETVTITPTGAGTASLSVRAVDDAGRDLEDVLEFTVSEP